MGAAKVVELFLHQDFGFCNKIKVEMVVFGQFVFIKNNLQKEIA